MGHRERSPKGTRKYFELNDNENTTYQSLWEVAKSMFRIKCIAKKFILQENKDFKITIKVFTLINQKWKHKLN